MNAEEYILQHRTDQIERLALQLHACDAEQKRYILQQIEGWQRLRHKVPQWAATEGLLYPVRLSLEQCSSETTALYKARLLPSAPAGDRGSALLVDLTGGLGVDFSFMAQGFDRAVYVEQNEELCRLARHNLPLLGLPRAEIVQGDGVEYLQTMTDTADVIFLDPYRRDEGGHKTVRIEDCTPNLLPLLPLLAQHSRRVIVKLSPMLDITQALRSLAAASVRANVATHIVGTQGEVKEILLDIRWGEEPLLMDRVMMVCHDDSHHLEYRFAQESQVATAHYSRYCSHQDLVGAYLYEPAPVIMKAGCFRLLTERFGLTALHPNSHLYMSPSAVADFPGRQFRVLRVSGFGKKELKDFLRQAPQHPNGKGACANLAVRNFPMSVAELRQRMHLLDGGTEYWFATTLADESKVIVACSK